MPLYPLLFSRSTLMQISTPSINKSITCSCIKSLVCFLVPTTDILLINCLKLWTFVRAILLMYSEFWRLTCQKKILKLIKKLCYMNCCRNHVPLSFTSKTWDPFLVLLVGPTVKSWNTTVALTYTSLKSKKNGWRCLIC